MTGRTRRPSRRPWDAKNFDARRRAAGISVEALAVRAGLGRSTVLRALSSGTAKPGAVVRLRTALKALRREQANAHVLEGFRGGDD